MGKIKEEGWICWECQQKFRTIADLKQHRKETKHKIKEPKLVCECGKTFKNSQALLGHYSHCEIHLGHEPKFISPFALGKGKKSKEGGWDCPFCNQNFRTRNELTQHKKDEHPEKMVNGRVWNKGLTKETDERVKKNGETLSKRIKEGKIIPSFKGKHHTKSTRDYLSNKAKEGIINGTHYTWQVRNGHSYPEKWFISLLYEKFGFKENIDYKTEFKIDTKFVDFFFENINLIIEIDGTQHYKTKNDIYSDIKRDNLFKKEKYNIIRIPWDNYKKNANFWIDFINKIFSNDNNLIKLCRINRKYIDYKRKLTFSQINTMKTIG